MRAAVLAAALAACGLGGCGDGMDELDGQMQDVADFARDNRVGSSADVFLVKHGFAGSDPVALIYGYADDMAFCMEIAEMYTAKYPDSPYSCQYAN